MDVLDIADPVITDIIAELKGVRASFEIIANIRDEQNLRDRVVPTGSDLRLRQGVIRLDALILEIGASHRNVRS